MHDTNIENLGGMKRHRQYHGHMADGPKGEACLYRYCKMVLGPPHTDNKLSNIADVEDKEQMTAHGVIQIESYFRLVFNDLHVDACSMLHVD
jgi:hypothetical protein